MAIMSRFRSFLQRAASAASGLLSYLSRNPSWAAVVAVAVISDILDYFGGAIPVIGDVIDIGTSAILYPKIGGTSTIFTLIELVPGADFLPTYTTITLYSLYKEHKQDIEDMADVPLNS